METIEPNKIPVSFYREASELLNLILADNQTHKTRRALEREQRLERSNRIEKRIKELKKEIQELKESM